MADHAYSIPATAIERRRRRQTIQQQRKHLESALERLLAAVEACVADLDALDGDADEEPSLAAPERHPPIPSVLIVKQDRSEQEFWAQGAADDREGDEHDGREPDVDDEHDLGWSEGQSLTGRVDVISAEEAGLGFLERVDQRSICAGYQEGWDGGAEFQCEDEGFDADREPNDCLPAVPDYHPEDQRQVVSGRFLDRVFYRVVGERGV